jgi:hypothetical protein
MHLMVDIETLGVRPGSSIIALGALLFDPHSTTAPERTFYLEFCRESCRSLGLHEEPETLAWWQQQSQPMPQGIFPITDGLNAFLLWISNAGCHINGVWANSPSFDIVLINHALRLMGREWPLRYSLERDVRTIRNLILPGVQLHNSHNALSDCYTQAALIQIAFKELQNAFTTRQPHSGEHSQS